MNERAIFRNRLAEEVDVRLTPYPDPMGRNDFRIACHIGTRRSQFMVPKTWLRGYPVSDDDNRITRKSGEQYGMIREVGRMKK